MLPDLDRLRSDPHLLELLSHYARLGAENRDTWQARLMHLEGVPPHELAKRYGELIAWGWVEQNTGHVPIGYRITLAGLRASQQAAAHGNEEDDPQEAAWENPAPRPPGPASNGQARKSARATR